MLCSVKILLEKKKLGTAKKKTFFNKKISLTKGLTFSDN